MNMKKMRKGFTLVELLIVIAVIGLLASSMMLASASSTASAQATNIISDLRSLKAAAIMHYMESMDVYAKTPSTTLTLANISPYMDNPKRVKGDATSGFQVGQVDAKWFVGYKVSDSDVQEKLAAKADSVGLLGDKTVDAAAYKKGDDTVWMAAR